MELPLPVISWYRPVSSSSSWGRVSPASSLQDRTLFLIWRAEVAFRLRISRFSSAIFLGQTLHFVLFVCNFRCYYCWWSYILCIYHHWCFPISFSSHSVVFCKYWYFFRRYRVNMNAFLVMLHIFVIIIPNLLSYLFLLLLLLCNP